MGCSCDHVAGLLVRAVKFNCSDYTDSVLGVIPFFSCQHPEVLRPEGFENSLACKGPARGCLCGFEFSSNHGISGAMATGTVSVRLVATRAPCNFLLTLFGTRPQLVAEGSVSCNGAPRFA